MNVYNRRLFFNRGGQVSARGTGITSGLIDTPKRGYVDGPGSYAGEITGTGSLLDLDNVRTPEEIDAIQTGNENTLAEKYKTSFETLRGLGIVPERKPFSRLAAASPALLELGGKLLSAKSLQGGVSGGLDILGQAASASAPGFAQAIQAKREYDAADPEAGLKNMALQMALKETPKNQVQSSTDVYGTFGTGKDAVTGYGFATTYKDGKREYEIGGKKYNSFTGLAEPEADKEETFFKGETVKIRKKDDPTGEIFDASFMTGNKGSLKFSAIGADKDFDANEYEIVDDLDYEGNVKVKIGNNIMDATQVWDGQKLITRIGTDILTPGEFTIVEQDDAKIYEDENYKLTINGQEYETLGVQEGKELFITDPRPNSPTKGQRINIKELGEDLEGLTKIKSQNFLSFEDQLTLQNNANEEKEKLTIASDAFKTLTNKGDSNAQKVAMYNRAEPFISKATTASFADQRAGFVKFLETLKIDELAPGAYNAIKTGLNAGSTVASEQLNAAAQKAFIANAQEYDDRLNNTEVGKLAAADFSLGMSAEGQQLMIDINREQAQIFVEGADLARLLASGPNGIERALEKYPALTEDMLKPFLQEDGRMKLFDVTNIANEYVGNRLINFGDSEEMKTRIDSALSIKPVGDGAFFDTLGERKTKSGHLFSPGDAYTNNQMKFAGYPSNGEFEYDGDTEVGLNNSKPVYIYEYEKGGEQFRVILQF